MRRGCRRLLDLESKLTDIIGLLSRSNAPLSGVETPVHADFGLSAILEYPGDSPHRVTEYLSGECLANSESSDGPASSGEQNTTESVLENLSNSSRDTSAAWIADLGLGPVVLEHLLDKFRGMASFFPFVRLSNDSTAESMVNDRPFLLLAAVAAASSKYCHLQDALIGKFKKSLSERVIMAGEKDLDLLQGLLVHLAWFQYHFVPGSQQAYQYIQIAISMVIDLRLEQEVADLLEQGIELGDSYNLEACRAYLGCYYLSGIIAMASQKPNNLPFHRDMLKCAMMLQQTPEFDTDLLLCPATKVLQFTEEACETYRLEGIHGARLHIHAERLETWLEDWWSSLSMDLRDTVLLINGYYAAKIRIEEMGLVYCYGQRRPPSPKTQDDSTILSAHPMVINNLIKCVSSAKEYLDLFCALPAAEHRTLPFSAWYQVIFTVFVLYRLSVELPEVPQWDVEIAQKTVDLRDYIDTLLSHLQAIEPLQDTQVPTRSLFTRLPEIIGSVRTSYASAKENPAEIRDSRRAHCELMGSNNTSSSVRRLHRCPGMRYLSGHSARAQPQPALQSAIATEVQNIEEETVWGDILFMDTFTSITDPSSIQV
ncbi:uncharacterized protein N7511_004734 [Penicillium nucicola]|uniref:uncharacterized protein n=1 Tax=Penicillium nucicola TaxID=1850975 RepID=UPI002545B440|nr:uncharacterized protein N7511_004734 [Penicillium nucicola]KAJ5767118.1 hypothetical protein N7511_004734 [Penicillium nucicola]